MASDVISVSSNKDFGDDFSSDERIILSEELKEVSVSRVEGLIDLLKSARINDSTSVPLYDLIDYSLVRTFYSTSLIRPVLVYEILEKCIENSEPNAIRSENVTEQDMVAILDVANAHGLDVHGQQYESVSRREAYLSVVYSNRYEIIDPFISTFINLFRENKKGGTRILVPKISRFDSFSPLLEDASEDDAIYTLEERYRWIWRTKKMNRYQSVKKYDPTPINTFVGLMDQLNLVRFYMEELPRELCRSRNIETGLVDLLKKEEGIDLTKTIKYVISNICGKMFDGGVTYYFAKRLLKDSNYNQIVVGSMAVRERALIKAADEAGIQTYYLPHSVVTGYENIAPSGTTHFVAGKPDKRHLENLEYVPEDYDAVASGRPRLKALYANDFTEFDHTKDEPIDVLVTTQPFEDRVREEFLTTILNGITRSEQEYSVTIKIHPRESEAFYQNILAESEATANIRSDDLIELFKSSDLVVTIDSNTGIEAIAVGTPCISINFWRSIIRESPYLSSGPIPRLASRSDVTAFFEDLDPATLEEHFEQQIQYAKDEYDITGTTVSNIQSILQSPNTNI
jgi:hypothetical protein